MMVRIVLFCLSLCLPHCTGTSLDDVRVAEKDVELIERFKRMVTTGGGIITIYKNDGVELTFNPTLPSASSGNTVDDVFVYITDILRGRSVFDYLYSAVKLAKIEKLIADHNGLPFGPIPIETIFDINEDIVFDLSDVMALEQELSNDPSPLALGISRTKRHATSRNNLLWPTTIPFTLSDKYSNIPGSRNTILNAMSLWEDETCLIFQEGATQGSSLTFTPLFTSCWSYLGKKSYPQLISVGADCINSPGKIAHLIGHALGFYPEHQRPDRDTYVDINWDNIPLGRRYFFLRRTWYAIESLGVPYGYSSIMHIAKDAFASSGNTISTKEPDFINTLGQRRGPSFNDIKLANLLYCSAKCPQGLKWDACEHEGYRDLKNCSICKCPDGWSGPYCETVAPDIVAQCGPSSITANSAWQNLTRDAMHSGSQCTWLITAPTGHNVVIRFTTAGLTLPCDAPCKQYVELRLTNVAREGPRFCCATPPPEQFTSHGNQILVLHRATLSSSGPGFKLEFKSEPCGGCSSNNLTAPACNRTESYSCREYYQEPCFPGSPTLCRRYRLNTCYRTVMTCCEHYALDGNDCIRQWTEWSEWSSCTHTCGGCGTRTRSRTLLEETQNEVKSCNSQVCSNVIAIKCRYYVTCGTWWSRRNCTRYRQCTRRQKTCCGGKTVRGNRCF